MASHRRGSTAQAQHRRGRNRRGRSSDSEPPVCCPVVASFLQRQGTARSYQAFVWFCFGFGMCLVLVWVLTFVWFWAWGRANAGTFIRLTNFLSGSGRGGGVTMSQSPWWASRSTLRASTGELLTRLILDVFVYECVGCCFCFLIHAW